jgi:hypothetical protein
MNNELDVNEILAAMRQQVGVMAQENAILTATVKKLENERSTNNCSCNKDN